MIDEHAAHIGSNTEYGHFKVDGVTVKSNPEGYLTFIGASGYSGWSGFSGPSGYSGWSGFSSSSGYSGWSGFTGTSGYSGFTGISGYSGVSGFSGWSGISGQGLSGYSGWSGFSSTSGFSGWSGLSGANGSSGQSGFSGWSGMAATGGAATITCSFGGGGSALSSGVSSWVSIPYGATITGWEIVADAVGSAVVEVSKAAYADYPTFISIDGTEAPTLVSQQKNQDLSLSTWTTGITTGDYVKFYLASVSGLAYIYVKVNITKT